MVMASESEIDAKIGGQFAIDAHPDFRLIPIQAPVDVHRAGNLRMTSMILAEIRSSSFMSGP